jgi:RND family efflux transporter MFP subunit
VTFGAFNLNLFHLKYNIFNIIMSNQKYTLPPKQEAIENSNKLKKVIPVIVVIAIVVSLWYLMSLLKPTIKKKEDTITVPVVTTIKISPLDFVIPIHAEGMVLPQTKINISSEVSGKIVYVSDKFSNGGSFDKDDILIKIDPMDYQLAITRAKASVAAQVANLDLEQAKSDLAKLDWKKYGKKGKANPLNLNLPQVASAKAALSGAKADLKIAQRNLNKTIIKAPFSGVILNKNVDLGQFVSLGTALASIASTEVSEIRVSLSDAQLRMSGLDDFSDDSDVNVSISSDETSQQSWFGKVAAVEAQRDARTLFNYTVVEIKEPFTQQAIPLRFNTFVEVEFDGKTLYSVIPLSRNYMMLNNKVKLLDSQSQLLIKTVEVAYSDDDYFYVSDGLSADDRVIITQLPGIKSGSKLKQSKEQ